MASEVVPFNPGKPPAHIRQGELSAAAKSLMGSGAGGKRVSIKGGVFRLLDGGKEIASVEERYLDVVIINAAPKVNRVWYAKKYDSESNVAPSCWSADGDAPDSSIEEPQSERCATCEKNIKGSGEGDSRACRYQQRVAVIMADDINEKSDVMQLTVPAASLFGKAEGDKRPLQEYARWLGAQKVSPELVITRMRFDTAAESPKLFFNPMRWLVDEEYEAVSTLATSDDAIKAITMTMAQRDETPPADALEGKPPTKSKEKPAAETPPPKTRAKKATTPPPPPPEDDEVEDEPPAPKTKKSPPPADDEDADPPAPPPKKKNAPLPDDEDADPPAPPPKKKNAPAPDDDADEPLNKRKGAGEAETKVKKSAADLVKDWGDD